MKPFVSFLIIFLFSFSAFSQPDSSYVHSVTRQKVVISQRALDTNQVIYDEQGNPLRYHEYQQLINSGEYTIRLTGSPNDSTTKPYLKRLTDEEKEKSLQRMGTLTMVKSPSLREKTILDVAPLRNVAGDNELNKKILVLVFWSPQCPPCTESFARINEITRNLPQPEDMTMLAITDESKEKADALIKQKPLNNARIITKAAKIFQSYQLKSYPTYVIAGKDHVIEFAVTGQGPQTMSAFEKALRKIAGAPVVL